VTLLSGYCCKLTVWARSYFKPFCEKHLIGGTFSIFSTVRHWMSSFSRVVRNSPPPVTVRWSGDEAVEVNGHLVVLKSYQSHIHSSVTKLQDLIDNQVLCGINLSDINICTKITADLDADNSTLHYSPLSHEMSEWMDNPDSDKFSHAILLQNKLGLKVGHSADGSPKFSGHTQEIWEWFAAVEEAWELLYCLYHVTSGLPGRGTEESMLQWANSTTGRRHLFTTDGAIQIISNYHKGTALTNTYKTITRLVLPQLSTIFLILLRIVRPFQLTLYLQFGSKPTKGKKPNHLSLGVIENYHTKIFIKNGRMWNTRDQSEALRNWFLQCFHAPLGIRWYRQFATALQRKWILELPHDSRILLMAIADEQAGHTGKTSETNYARKEGTSGDSESRIESFCAVSKLWQRNLGFEV